MVPVWVFTNKTVSFSFSHLIVLDSDILPFEIYLTIDHNDYEQGLG